MIVDLAYTVPRTDPDAPVLVEPVLLLDTEGAVESTEQYLGFIHTTRTFSLQAQVQGIASVDCCQVCSDATAASCSSGTCAAGYHTYTPGGSPTPRAAPRPGSG